MLSYWLIESKKPLGTITLEGSLELMSAKKQQVISALWILLSKQIVGKTTSTNNFIFKGRVFDLLCELNRLINKTIEKLG